MGSKTKLKRFRNSVTNRKMRPEQGLIEAISGSISRADFDHGLRLCTEFARLFPSSVFGWKAMGICLRGRKREAEAISCFERCIALSPSDAEAHNNLGVAFKDAGQLEEALASYRRAIAVNPSYAEAYNNLGNCLKALGKIDDSICCFREAIKLKPGISEFHCNLGNALFVTGAYEAAIPAFTAALEINRESAAASNGLGAALRELGHRMEAETYCRLAISLNPTYAEAHANLANVLQDLLLVSDAERSYRESIRHSPSLLEPRLNLAALLKDLGRFEEAEALCRESMSLDCSSTAAIHSLAVVLNEAGFFDEAERYYRYALVLDPQFTEARFNLSLLLLLQCRFSEGFELYESRLFLRDKIKHHQRFSSKRLHPLSKPCRGEKVLVYAEQGLGDSIQFCRYLSQLKQTGVSVIFEVQEQLIPILKSLNSVDFFVARGSALPQFDSHIALLSLPYLFDTQADSIPSAEFYLNVSEESIWCWRERLGSYGFRIGIHWQGFGETLRHLSRSIPVGHFAEIGAIPEVRLISLQSNVKKLTSTSFPIEILSDQLDHKGAFLDTAAIMKCCDLVITNDTSIAHLGGALGVRTWVAVKCVPDWRWALNRINSPWYPSLRIFRQRTIGDWEAVFKAMATELRAVLKGYTRRTNIAKN